MKNTFSSSQKWDKKTFKNIVIASIFIPLLGFIIGIKDGFKNTAIAPQARMILIISLISAFLWIGIFDFFSTGSSSLDESQLSNVYIQSVYDGHLKNFPNKTIGKVIDKNLKNIEWTAYEKVDSSFSDVFVSGDIKVKDKTERLRFVFLVNNKDNSIIEVSGANTKTEGFFEPQAIEIYRILYNR